MRVRVLEAQNDIYTLKKSAVNLQGKSGDFFSKYVRWNTRTTASSPVALAEWRSSRWSEDKAQMLLPWHWSSLASYTAAAPERNHDHGGIGSVAEATVVLVDSGADTH